jgi:hypothetical protein
MQRQVQVDIAIRSGLSTWKTGTLNLFVSLALHLTIPDAGFLGGSGAFIAVRHPSASPRYMRPHRLT